MTDFTAVAKQIPQAFAEGSGRWPGCDWPTQLGKGRLDLNGMRAREALLVARATAGGEARDWGQAAAWLAEVERDAQEAERQALSARDLALSGRADEALRHAQRACDIEAKYHTCLVWQPLRDAIEALQDTP